LDSILSDLKYDLDNNYELVIVDGNSTDGTQELVKEYARKYNNIHYIAQCGSGLPNARNRGLEFVRGNTIVFFDDDVILRRGYFGKLKTTLASSSSCLGGISGVYQKSNTSLPHIVQTIKAALDRLFVGGWIGESAPIGKVLPNGFSTCNFEYASTITKVDRLTGCNMIYPRNIIEKCGRFDEKYVGNIGEDTDFSYRVKKLGFSLIIDPNLQLIHVDVQDKAFPFSERCLYYSALNEVYFFFKNLYDGKLFSLFQFIQARCYTAIMYLLGGLIYNRPVLGLNYLSGFLEGIRNKKDYCRRLE